MTSLCAETQHPHSDSQERNRCIMLDVGRGIVIGLQRARGTMDFASSLLLLAAIFVIGFGAGYAFRALISATHRRRYERHRGFPQQNSR
jgi:hypothetical protein